MSPELQEQINSFNEIGEKVCQSLTEYLSNIGMEAMGLPQIAVSELVYSQQRDPFSGEVSLYGEWRNKSGILCGNVSYRPDGTLYIEHDVLQLHPKKPQWIIEAVTAWGTVDDLKMEPRLMPALQD